MTRSGGAHADSSAWTCGGNRVPAESREADLKENRAEQNNVRAGGRRHERIGDRHGTLTGTLPGTLPERSQNGVSFVYRPALTLAPSRS